MTTVPLALTETSFNSPPCIVFSSSPEITTKSKDSALLSFPFLTADKFWFKEIFCVLGITVIFALAKRKERAKRRKTTEISATNQSLYLGLFYLMPDLLYFWMRET